MTTPNASAPTPASSDPSPRTTAERGAVDEALLRAISQRVLWLSTAIVEAANRGRPNSSGVKVGGHQASSASMVDIMVALWFHSLGRHDFEAEDRAFFERVAAAYRARMSAEPARFVRIDAARDRDGVWAQIRASLEARGW